MTCDWSFRLWLAKTISSFLWKFLWALTCSLGSHSSHQLTRSFQLYTQRPTSVSVISPTRVSAFDSSCSASVTFHKGGGGCCSRTRRREIETHCWPVIFPQTGDQSVRLFLYQSCRRKKVYTCSYQLARIQQYIRVLMATRSKGLELLLCTAVHDTRRSR